MKILSILPKNFKYVLSPLLVTTLLTGNAYAIPVVANSQEVAQFPQLSLTTRFHVDNKLPFPVRVRAIRDGRSDINQTLNPGDSFRGNIDRRAGVRIVVYASGDCGDTEIMPSSYARVYTTETFRIREDGIKRVVADKVDPWSRVAGTVVTGVALYYAPEYGPAILAKAGVKEAVLASCADSLTSLSCLNGIVSYAEDIKRQYGDNSVAYNQCLREARERAETLLSHNPINSVEERFRAVNDWAGRHGYGGGFPNFHQADPGSGVVYGTILLKPEAVEWRDIPASELGNPRTIEERFRAVNDWAGRHGYGGGFPNFHQADPGSGVVYGTILLKPKAVEWRDIPASELGNPRTIEERFRAVNDWAGRHGYRGGFPNFHQADPGSGVVYGTILLKPKAVEWRDIPVAELR